jgi:hypothetical protein
MNAYYDSVKSIKRDEKDRAGSGLDTAKFETPKKRAEKARPMTATKKDPERPYSALKPVRP